MMCTVSIPDQAGLVRRKKGDRPGCLKTTDKAHFSVPAHAPSITVCLIVIISSTLEISPATTSIVSCLRWSALASSAPASSVGINSKQRCLTFSSSSFLLATIHLRASASQREREKRISQLPVPSAPKPNPQRKESDPKRHTHSHPSSPLSIPLRQGLADSRARAEDDDPFRRRRDEVVSRVGVGAG
jgi:hypothetical protein